MHEPYIFQTSHERGLKDWLSAVAAVKEHNRGDSTAIDWYNISYHVNDSDEDGERDGSVYGSIVHLCLT
jgi:hypothetical protein